MRYSEKLNSMPDVTDKAPGHVGTRTNQGTECYFWAIRRNQPVQVGRLVSYALVFIYLSSVNQTLCIGLKKSTLTSFYSKNPYPKVFSALPTSNQRKTCIKHTFLTQIIVQTFFYRPTYPFFLPLQETNNFFSWPNKLLSVPHSYQYPNLTRALNLN